MRWIGAALVVIAAALFGHLLASEKERRIRELESLVQALDHLETEIVYGMSYLAEAFARTGRLHGRVAALFLTAGDELSKGRDSVQAWAAGLSAMRARAALDPDDYQPLCHLGGVLGRSSAADQGRRLALTKRQLELRLDDAREKVPQTARLVRALGVGGGTALALMLI